MWCSQRRLAKSSMSTEPDATCSAFDHETALTRHLFELIPCGEALMNVFPLPRGVQERRVDTHLELPNRPKREIGITVQSVPGPSPRSGMYLVLFRDLEELRSVRIEMRRLERLSSLGEMAAGSRIRYAIPWRPSDRSRKS